MRKAALILTVLGLVPVLIYGGLTLAFRGGAVGFGTVFGALPWLVPALGIGALAALVGFVVMLAKRAPVPALASLVVALAAGAMAYGPVTMKGQAAAVPFIHDVTTDTADPPVFVAILPLRADAPNPPDYDREQTEAQLGYYTDLGPLLVERPYAEVFGQAVEAVEAEGMRVVAAVPREGRIEAVATTRWFGFKDDVVLRLRDAHGKATVVDMRSKSRMGGSDLGANAARIEAVLGRIEAASAA